MGACITKQGVLHVIIWEGRREGSALLKNGSLVPARCTTLHKALRNQAVPADSGQFQARPAAPVCCCVGGESHAIAALQGGN